MAEEIIVDGSRYIKKDNQGSSDDSSLGGGCSSVFYLLVLIGGLFIYGGFDYISRWFDEENEYRISVKTANFREKPTKNSKVLKKLSKGESIFIIEDTNFINENWAKAISEEDTGWIYKTLISK
ncbi:SH3 domain-containing protein [Flavobacteriales bacterium]|nr:SH3 domain-containing protein [Flavobacteriales bacterium]